MAVDARTEEFQHLELFDKFALFTNARIDRTTVPKGWYCYDFRGTGDDPGELRFIEESVVVNHSGSILMPEKLELPASGQLDAWDEFGFLDECDMTLREFCEVHDLPYPAEEEEFHIRPARPDEAGLFYAQHSNEPPVGRVTFVGDDAQEFTDAEAFLKCIREELPYFPTTGFRCEVLTDDPAVRKQVDDIFYDFFGEENAPTARAAGRFVDCFYSEQELTREVESEDENGETVTETETYTAITPLSLSAAYKNLSAELGREISDEDKDNIRHIYTMIAGPMGIENYTGAYEVGGQKSVEIDLSTFSDPSTKNAHDLAAYAINAWQSGWGYVWGTYGQIMTEELFASKLQQYPEGVGSYADFIQANWVGGRTADCVGLIKGYGWLDSETLELRYCTNGMPDVGANQMYYNATVSGTIDTIPDTPGLAVWHDGHIGVYIGNGEVIEAMGTKYGVVKTQLEGRGWTHWLQVPYISYD